MNNLTESQIKSLQLLLQSELGMSINKHDAKVMGVQLVTLIKSVIGQPSS